MAKSEQLFAEMRVLWVVNTVFPDVAPLLGVTPPVSGGWMYGLLNKILAEGDIVLSIATVHEGNFCSHEINGVQYFLLKKLNEKAESRQWKKVVDEFRPDLVHIHGTEYPHGFSLIESCPGLKYLVSIQGLVEYVAKYYFSGLSFSDIFRSITLRDILRLDTMFQAKNKFSRQAIIERLYLANAAVIVGRTEWDRVHALIRNPSASYYHCNESLRDEFYCSKKWSLADCESYSIFVSQAAYPIKGLHQLLRAVALLIDKFPRIRVNISGYDITASRTLKQRIKRTGYGKLILSLIQDLKLDGKIFFLGQLSASEMRKQYLLSHVFVCPSSVENSPNSLGEAQILGVPCVASYCGGIPSFVTDRETALLYQFDEFEMLASKIANIFECNDLAMHLSVSGRKEALLRHDRDINLGNLMVAYNSLMEDVAKVKH